MMFVMNMKQFSGSPFSYKVPVIFAWFEQWKSTFTSSFDLEGSIKV